MSFVDKKLYVGKVTKQEMVEGRDQHPQLNLYVMLAGQLVDNNRPEGGAIDCPKVEVCAQLRFPSDNPEALGYAADDLEKLGFDGEDIGVLAPGAKKHVSFVGRDVYVMPSTKVYNDTPQTFWNLRFPRKRDVKAVEAAKLSKSKAADAYRDALKRRREQSSAAATEGLPF